MHTTSAMLLIGAVLLLAAIPAGAVKIEKTNYFNQPDCYKLSNGTAEVIVTTAIGPRIISYRLADGANILSEIGPNAVVKTELGDWRPWGGHRLWHAPESMPRSYVPDNDPISAEIVGNDSVQVTRMEEVTGIEKEMLIKLDAKDTRVTITHKLTNKGLWPVELAPWGLTIMKGGGVTIFPNEPYISHDDKLTPARPLVVWHYTDLSDPRWKFGKKYTRLQCDPKLTYCQKIGAANKQGWAAYLLDQTLFVKQFPYVDGAEYPDYGCNFETYTDGNFMEIESLGPLVKLEPGQSAIHIEHWFLFKDVKAGDDDASLEKTLNPLLKRTI